MAHLCSGQRATRPVPAAVTNRPAVRSVRCSVFTKKNAAAAQQVGKEWLETILSRFGPATDKAQNITTLDFEKPLLELDKRIKEVRARFAKVQRAGVMSNAAHAGSDRLRRRYRFAKLLKRTALT